MNFTQQTYVQLSTALPDMTARKFSAYCGMSEGYFGSITAQGLEASTNALLHLAEVLEQRSRKMPSCRLELVMQAIAHEIARRVNDLPSANYAIRRLVIGAVAKVNVQRDLEISAPPILIV